MHDLLAVVEQPPSNAEMLAAAAAISAIGGLLIVAAVKDWDWVFTSRKYRLLVSLIGRTGCRFVIGGTGAAAILFMCVRLLIDLK